MPNVLPAIINAIDHSIKKNEGPFFTYIIGNNGSGKSRILRYLAEHYSNDDARHVRTIPCISNSVYDRFEMRRFEKAIYLGSRSVNNAVFHATIDRELARHISAGISNQRNFLKRFTEAIDVEITVKFTKVSEPSRQKRSPIINYIDQRKLKQRNIETIITESEQEWLIQNLENEIALKKLTKANAQTLEKFLTLNPSTSVVIKKSNGEFEFKDLSSGEQNRILTAAKLMSSANDKSLVILDEPEISLHLHWQMELHNSFKKMLANLKNFHVVIATHSPVIVSEAAKDSSNQHIVVLKSADDTSSIYQTLPKPQPSSPEEGEDENFYDGLSFKSGDIRSHEGLVLDFFDTATYKTSHVIEEIADTVLQSQNGEITTADAVKELQVLLKKKGISRDNARMVRKAINLIETYII